MIKIRQYILFVIAAIVTVLYFWYLGYNVMVLDNPIIRVESFNSNKEVVYLSSWE